MSTAASFFAWQRLLPGSLGALALCIAIGAACNGGTAAIQLTLPADVSANATWFEVAAYKESNCLAILPMLANGVPDGATARIAWNKADKKGPIMGDIPSGHYAFAAVARDETCAVIATGCKEQEASASHSLSIALATTNPTGACSDGATCLAGMCVPATNNSDPSVGAGCSLELIGAGPLPTPIARDKTLMSAPAIAVTNLGFLIVYRQVDAQGTEGRLVFLPIDQAGGSYAYEAGMPGLTDICESADQTDGIGLFVKDDLTGRVTLSRPACDTKPALELLNFALRKPASEKVEPEDHRADLGKLIFSPSPNDFRLALSPTHSTSMRPSGDVIVFTEGGVARIANVDAEKGIVGPNGSFGGTTGITGAWVAANDKILALLAAGPRSTGPTTSLDGGTSDGGADGGPDPTPTPTPTEAELRLLVLPSSTALDTINAEKSAPRAPITFAGTWGSVATLGGRALVLGGNAGDSEVPMVSIRSYDLNNDSLADSVDLALGSKGAVTAGDIVTAGNRAYVAALQEKAVTLRVYDNAATSLTTLREIELARVPRISAMSTVRDGRVAVAATESRVAVTWTTASVLGQYDNAGGYAVFACTQLK